jgi:hypothetical protein
VRGTPAVLTSIAVHGVALIAMARWGTLHVAASQAASAPSAVAPTPPIVVAPAAPAEPIAVGFLDDARPAGGRREGGSPQAGGPVGDARIAGTRGGATEELPGRPGDTHGTGRSWMKMRGPSLAVSEGFVDELLRNSKPLETVRKSGRVRPDGRGRAVIHDRVTTVAIDPDGTAHFHDQPDVDLHWDLHLPTPDGIVREVRKAGRLVATWYEDPYKQTRVGAKADVPAHMAATPGACDSWNDACSLELRGRDAPEDEDRQAVVHGKLDLTSMLMRKYVGDPYASRKRALLDSTRDERAAAGAQHTKEELARSAERMQRNLEAMWRTIGEPAARREALFTMWDDCAEGDGPIGEAGERARRMVVGWIRARLPAASPDAFTADDIARRSARRTSKQPFAPYE